jgi:uncharacterized protein
MALGAAPYPIPIRALLFEEALGQLDPLYNQPGIDCYASRLKKQLTGALDAAVTAAGGRPVTIAGTRDAVETFKFAAIRQLAQNPEFQEKVRTNGIRWGVVQGILADCLPETIGGRFQWVYDQGLVKRALDDILGEGGWDTEGRPSEDGKTRQWIVITDRVKPRIDSVPDLPPDWPSEEDDSPPPGDGLF